MRFLSKRLLFLSLACLLVPCAATANEQAKELIKHGFALREQAIQTQTQAKEMIRLARKLDKTAILYRLNSKPSTSTDQIDPVVLNKASETLNQYGAKFRSAHNELIISANAILLEGFLRYWQNDIIHTKPMYIEGSFANGKTSDLLKKSFSAQNKPEMLDVSIGKPSSDGLYYIIIQSLEYPLTLNQFHTWRIIIADKEAKPVNDLNITINGDMPSHGHGMATTPKILPENKPGIYPLEGMKFQMRGWWIITLTLDGKQGRDTVSFNLDL